jgi:hypothetical protein
MGSGGTHFVCPQITQITQITRIALISKMKNKSPKTLIARV